VAIDLKPGTHSNTVNPAQQRNAILTTGPRDAVGLFDATTVDPNTVRLGETSPTAASVHHEFADVDADGDGDLLLHFRTQDVAVECEATSVVLIAKTYDGQRIRRTDAIRVVGCAPGADLKRGEKKRGAKHPVDGRAG
jgi:hypothetical protein